MPEQIWKFGLTDLAGLPIGEILNAYERKLTLPLNGLPTASCRLRLDDPLADEISDRNGDCLLKVYQEGTLRFVGDLTSIEEVGGSEGATLAVTAAGPLWRLQKRMIGKHSLGRGFTETAASEVLRLVLDDVNVDSNTTGIQEGTLDALYETNAGQWYFKPASEVFTEMQEAKVPYPIGSPVAFVARDTFDQVSGGALTGQNDNLGNTWASAGSTDFQVETSGHTCGRSAVSDANYRSGRWAINGVANQAAVIVGIDYQAGVSYSSGHNFYPSVIARYQDTSNWLMAFVDFSVNAFCLDMMRTPNAPVRLGTFNFSPGGPAANTLYSIRLQVDALGNYSAWHYATASGIGPVMITGQHADLATGGVLATGKVGFTDALSTATPVVRFYDNFLGSTNTGPQSFDFEFAPIEPTGSPVKIANMNIRYAIGTSKPEVIFEYGTGGRTVKSYRRITDRQGMLNQAFVLNDGFPSSVESATDVKVATDATSIAARGLFEEVISTDVQDPQLRQALADAHVDVRKIPRQLITFEPSENAPEFGDYIVGDTVTARAIVNGNVRFNALFRVWGVEITIDEEGKETIVPTLAPE